ncbi:MAG: transposase [Elusimicrobia bacterium]|nr:transposase [Elusimicrobiota bacterium]
MARKNRVVFAGAYYHVISRGNNKESIFKDRQDKLKFLQILEKYRDKFDLIVYSYSLMTNHIHLFIKTNKANLSQAMKMINWSYAVYFNRKYYRNGHLFQSRFISKTVKSESYLLALIRYIHNNCVKAKITSRPEFYEWCSHKDYLYSDRSVVNGIGEIMDFFSNNIKEYDSFIKSKIPQEEFLIFDRLRNEDLDYALKEISSKEKIFSCLT